jgi:uncharacterized OB-fold protein
MSEPPALHSRRPLTLNFDIPISKTKEFWDSLKSGKFVTTKCSKCGNVTFPPQADCPRCMSNEFSWVDIGREARLVTFTQVRTIPASFAGNDPYIIAIGELQGGIKVLAWLEGTTLDKTRPGMTLRVEARSSTEGNPYYVFVPA